MSKNAEALRKAKEALESLSRSDESPQAPETRDVVLHHETDLSKRSASSVQISRMGEPRPLDPENLAKRRIIHPDMENRESLNVFRELRTKLLQVSRGQNFVAMLTSVPADGGGSFVSMNLAASIAFDEAKTSLVIDCNLLDPTLDTVMGVDTEYGLTDFLLDPSIGVDEVIYPSGIPRLRLIPVGKKQEHVAEFFTSTRMRGFLDVVKRRYPDRFIFIDAPPVSHSADARILSDLCDYAILVVGYGQATAADIEAAVEVVGRNKLVGVVFNKKPNGI